jgi:D-sedoheptulose 7-phosphate isomerase
MDNKSFILTQLAESATVKEKTASSCLSEIIQAVNLIVAHFRNRGKLLICGNGGSAADAQHLAAELIIRLSHDIKRPGLPAIALNTDSSILTAGGNDIGYKNVFSRQVDALGFPEDILIVITTSGNSENIVSALKVAKAKGLKCIGFLGNNGGVCANIVDIPIIVPSSNTQRIQETHITIGHIIIELVERELFQK